MIRLDLNRKERWIEVLPGVKVLVRPMGTAFWMMAKSDDAVLAAVREASPVTPDEGVDEVPAPMTDASVAFSVALTKAVAKRVVTDWSGVGDMDGVVLPCTPDGVAALLDVREAYDAFCAEVLGPWLRVLDEKKD